MPKPHRGYPSLSQATFYQIFIFITLSSFSSILTADQFGSVPFRVLEVKDHNANSFTQGWAKEGEVFYESSGLYGRSFIHRYSNNSKTTRYLPSHYFAEGLTLLGDTLYLLTWKEETLLLVNKHSLETVKTLSYKGEGWGLTHDGKQLIMSNGSSTLFFRQPKDFSIIQQLTIKGLDNINELEYIDGIIWANRWNDNHIYAINPKLSCAVYKLNLSSLRAKTVKPDTSNVLNGLAYDRAQNALWVTGKLWPKRYLITVPPALDLEKKTCL